MGTKPPSLPGYGPILRTSPNGFLLAAQAWDRGPHFCILHAVKGHQLAASSIGGMTAATRVGPSNVFGAVSHRRLDRCTRTCCSAPPGLSEASAGPRVGDQDNSRAGIAAHRAGR